MNEEGLAEELKYLRKQLSLGLEATPGDLEVQRQIDDLLKEYLWQLPEFNRFRCFMVDFVGSDTIEPGSIDIEAFIDDRQAFMDKFGGLSVAVRLFLQSRGARVTDSGGGACGWHYGAYCTPGEAWVLFITARDHFEKAVRSGLLNIRIIPWSVRPAEEP